MRHKHKRPIKRDSQNASYPYGLTFKKIALTMTGGLFLVFYAILIAIFTHMPMATNTGTAASSGYTATHTPETGLSPTGTQMLQPTSTNVSTSVPSPTMEATSIPSPVVSPSAQPIVTPSPTAHIVLPTPGETPEVTPSPTAVDNETTPSPQPRIEPSPTPSPVEEPTMTPTAQPTTTPSPTAQPTVTPTKTAQPTATSVVHALVPPIVMPGAMVPSTPTPSPTMGTTPSPTVSPTTVTSTSIPGAAASSPPNLPPASIQQDNNSLWIALPILGLLMVGVALGLCLWLQKMPASPALISAHTGILPITAAGNNQDEIEDSTAKHNIRVILEHSPVLNNPVANTIKHYAYARLAERVQQEYLRQSQAKLSSVQPPASETPE